MSQTESSWPTPRFKRPDTGYECARCPAIVSPRKGDKQAALVVAGATIKVCGDCAIDLQAEIQEGA